MANNATPLELDNSKRSHFVACPRKYLLAHHYGLSGKYGRTALRYGTAWHGMMEGYYSDIKNNGWGESNLEVANEFGVKAWNDATEEAEIWVDDYRSYENCLTAFMHYTSEFASDRNFLKVIDTETLFKIPMVITPEEEQHFPLVARNGVTFTGKLDLHCTLSGQNWIMEFKTTGQSLALQLARLERTPQLIGYNYAARQLGYDIAGNLVSMHHILSRKSNVTEQYGKVTMTFQRQPHIYTTGDLDEWRNSFLFTAEQILQAGELNQFPMMFDSCYQFGPCGYLPLCQQNRVPEDLDTGNYVTKFWDVLKTGHGRIKEATG